MTVQLLEDTPAVLSLGKLCEEDGYTCEWASGQKPHLAKDASEPKPQEVFAEGEMVIQYFGQRSLVT